MLDMHNIAMHCYNVFPQIDALKQELDMKQDELNKATEEWKRTQEKLKLTVSICNHL